MDETKKTPLWWWIGGIIVLIAVFLVFWFVNGNKKQTKRSSSATSSPPSPYRFVRGIVIATDQTSFLVDTTFDLKADMRFVDSSKVPTYQQWIILVLQDSVLIAWYPMLPTEHRQAPSPQAEKQKEVAKPPPSTVAKKPPGRKPPSRTRTNTKKNRRYKIIKGFENNKKC